MGERRPDGGGTKNDIKTEQTENKQTSAAETKKTIALPQQAARFKPLQVYREPTGCFWRGLKRHTDRGVRILKGEKGRGPYTKEASLVEKKK